MSVCGRSLRCLRQLEIILYFIAFIIFLNVGFFLQELNKFYLIVPIPPFIQQDVALLYSIYLKMLAFFSFARIGQTLPHCTGCHHSYNRTLLYYIQYIYKCWLFFFCKNWTNFTSLYRMPPFIQQDSAVSASGMEEELFGQISFLYRNISEGQKKSSCNLFRLFKTSTTTKTET